MLNYQYIAALKQPHRLARLQLMSVARFIFASSSLCTIALERGIRFAHEPHRQLHRHRSQPSVGFLDLVVYDPVYVMSKEWKAERN
jgi:hypothetical protein